MRLLDGSHYDARLSDQEVKLIRLWIETGAAYPGTYAALGTGMIGGFEIVDRSTPTIRARPAWVTAFSPIARASRSRNRASSKMPWYCGNRRASRPRCWITPAASASSRWSRQDNG